MSHRAVGSPSDAIFQDFITRSKTADDVYIILKDMGHVAGMNILKDYGTYIIILLCYIIHTGPGVAGETENDCLNHNVWE